MAKGLHRRGGRSSRYSGYTGGPDPLAPPVDLREALEAIGQDVMEGSSPRRAMQELLRRGTQNMRGADKLAAEANRRRRELLQRNNLDGTLQEIKKLLDEAVLAERKELARALDDDARFNEMRIESLPPSPAKAVQELSDYEWRSDEAREKYDQIKDLLGREMLDQRFAGMKQALENATDEDRQRVNDMLDDLNDLLDKHSRGEDSQQDFDDFMKKHGEFFPENPQNVDELLDSLAQRAAAAQRFRNSLSADQRAELDALAQQAFGSPSLMNALNRLDGHLQAARPGEDWNGSSRFSGDNPLGMGEGAQAMSDIAELEQLAEALSQSYAGATMEDVDLEALARQLGPEAAVDAQTLSELEKALVNQGFLDRGSDGQWRLSPKAMRQLGQTALRDVAQQLSGRHGERETRRAGAAGELTGATRAWQFGDTEPWNVTRTLTNAVLRQAGTGVAELPLRHQRRGRRGVGDRDPRTGGCGAAGGHLVLDGDGEPLAADEANRAGAQPSGRHPVPLGCVANHRFWTVCADGVARGADRARGRLRAGHQPASRARAGRPAPSSTSQRAACCSGRDGRRTDRPPRELR